MAKLIFLIVFVSSLVKFENVLGVDDVDDKKKQEQKRKKTGRFGALSAQIDSLLNIGCMSRCKPCATCSASLALDRYLLFARK